MNWDFQYSTSLLDDSYSELSRRQAEMRMRRIREEAERRLLEENLARRGSLMSLGVPIGPARFLEALEKPEPVAEIAPPPMIGPLKVVSEDTKDKVHDAFWSLYTKTGKLPWKASCS